ncbi:MAG: GAP family protein [Thermomicrobiales bacterium]|nr:GAP family protein [Thermomicrobiales bacterium]MCO5219329.1 GAP family protein [Thermomicrobiales bacterium]MCO5225889.1 GAP family protein [Thermomicrobiales bacterium]MCO5227577.1 GAP family protein [Thermomicrobiales bacterium]
MQEVIGSLLPFALTIALGPIPIITIAIMLQTASPKRTGVGFAIGWMLGMTVLAVVLTMLSSQIPTGDADHPRRWLGLVQLLLGIGMLALAVKKIRSRIGSVEEAAVPGFLSSLADTTPARAVLVGVVVSAVNPKHIVLVLPVGTLILQHGLDTGQVIVAIALFVVISSITVAGAAIAYLASPERIGIVVDAGYRWMVRNMAVVSAAVLLLIGINILGKGIANFWG